MSAPNLAGFRDAQARLRASLGTIATFHIPVDATWAPDVPLDPETGRPYDPFATPASGGGERDEPVQVTTTEALPMPRRDDVNQAPVGRLATDDIGLDLAAADYARVRDAAHVTVFGQRYKVEDFRPSGLGDVDRYIAYCRSV